MARSADARNTLGYRASLINYANDLRTTTVHPALPLLSAGKPETRNLDSPLRFVPHPSILFYVRFSRAMLVLPPLSIRLTALFSFSISLSPFFLLRVPSILILATQLARLFIKTSKLTGFNRVRFTLFVCALVYYLLRYKQHPTFSLLTPRPPSLSLSAPLILSRANRVRLTPSLRNALSSASLSFPRHSTSSFSSRRGVYTIRRVSFSPS